MRISHSNYKNGNFVSSGEVHFIFSVGFSSFRIIILSFKLNTSKPETSVGNGNISQNTDFYLVLQRRIILS